MSRSGPSVIDVLTLTILESHYTSASSTSQAPSLSTALKRRAGILVNGNLHGDVVEPMEPAGFAYYLSCLLHRSLLTAPYPRNAKNYAKMASR